MTSNTIKNREYRLMALLTSRSVVFHLFIWLVVIAMLSVLTSLNGSWPFGFYFLNMLVAIPVMLIFTYFMGYATNLFLFRSKQFGWFFLLFVLATVGCSFLIPLFNHWIFFGLFYPRIFEPDPWFNWQLLPQNIILLWFPYLLISMKTFFTHWFKAEQEKLIIENKQLLAEIQLMKIKLHPHFLFNTLNNLYAMSQIHSDKTPDYIMKLSEIYRIMLYECNKEYFKVNSELLLIRNYIELEKIRYDQRLNLRVAIPERVNEEFMMPPLLYFTFVENAFKHGSRNDTGAPFILIELVEELDSFVFRAQNSVPASGVPKSEFGGYGLENTMKRLELIYQNDYEFRNGMNNQVYEVYLELPKLSML